MKEALLNDMREYSNIRIMNTISQSNSFSEDVVNAAKSIAVERNILSEDKLDMVAQLPKFKKMAMEQIQNGVAPAKIKSNLMAKGLTEDFANDVMNDAARSITIQEKAKEKDGGSNVWMVVFIIFIVVKMIFRMATY